MADSFIPARNLLDLLEEARAEVTRWCPEIRESLLNQLSADLRRIAVGGHKPDPDWQSRIDQALVEAINWTRVIGALRQVPSHLLPRRRIKQALEGRGAASKQARDAFFELDIAAFLLHAGLQVTSFDDVAFEFEGVEFYVECKRLSGKSSVRNNLERACEQVRVRLDKSGDAERSRGLVAVSVETLYGLDSSPMVAFEESEPDRTTRQLVRRFDLEFGPVIKTALGIETRILGVLVRAPFLVKRGNEVFANHILSLTPWCSAAHGQLKDELLVRDLAERLRSRPWAP